METFWERTEISRLYIREKLTSAGIPDEVIADIIASGYHMMNEDDDYLWDGHYGTLYPLSVQGIKSILEKQTKTFLERETQTIEVNSIADANIKLKEFISRFNPALSNRWAFRGVPAIWDFERKFPNPFVCDSEGKELSFFPSYWRNKIFGENYLNRISPDGSIFSSIYADEIIYDGIEDWQNLSIKNLEKYGPHSLSDLEDFPEPENQEYFKRFMAHKGDNFFSQGDLYYLEQHYGFETTCLDITFDLPTAMFFALNNFVFIDKDKNIATYKPVEDITIPVVYVFLFTSDIMTSNDIIRKFEVYSHLPPLRPIRQTCQQFGTNMFSINEPAAHIALKIRFSPDFDPEGIPSQSHLIPSREDDKFYNKLLSLKDQEPGIWGRIVDYH